MGLTTFLRQKLCYCSKWLSGEALFEVLKQMRNIIWFCSSRCSMGVQRNPPTPELFCCWLPRASSTSNRNTVPALYDPPKQWEGRFGVSFTQRNLCLSKQGENQQHSIRLVRVLWKLILQNLMCKGLQVTFVKMNCISTPTCSGCNIPTMYIQVLL